MLTSQLDAQTSVARLHSQVEWAARAPDARPSCRHTNSVAVISAQLPTDDTPQVAIPSSVSQRLDARLLSRKRDIDFQRRETPDKSPVEATPASRSGAHGLDHPQQAIPRSLPSPAPSLPRNPLLAVAEVHVQCTSPHEDVSCRSLLLISRKVPRRSVGEGLERIKRLPLAPRPTSPSQGWSGGSILFLSSSHCLRSLSHRTPAIAQYGPRHRQSRYGKPPRGHLARLLR